MREKLFSNEGIQAEIIEAKIDGEIAAFGKSLTDPETGEPVDFNYRELMPVGLATNLEIASPFYKQWVEERRLSNPLIGKKYFERSEEDCVPDKLLNDQVEIVGTEVSDAMADAIDNGNFEALQSEMQEDIDIDLTDLLGGDTALDDIDTKLMDIEIIKNVVRKNAGASVEEIESKVRVAMQDNYDNADYKSLIDLFRVINMCKTRLEIGHRDGSVREVLEFYKDAAEIPDGFVKEDVDSINRTKSNESNDEPNRA